MSEPAFETLVPGKWVLAGEHAVLRGAPAIALPHPDLSLRLRFEPGTGPLAISPARADRTVREILSSLEFEPRGRLTVESGIPVGSGLGSSAALCVALARWAKPVLAEKELFALARSLEDRFHGRSSGMDVAVALAGAPIVFQLKGSEAAWKKIELRALPRFEFHDTGIRSRTRDCVERVAELATREPARARLADERMGGASRLAEHGLAAFSDGRREEGLRLVAHAMEDAQACFSDWGLVPASVSEEAKRIRASGALAVKLTGAGAGGFLVSLWS